MCMNIHVCVCVFFSPYQFLVAYGKVEINEIIERYGGNGEI